MAELGSIYPEQPSEGERGVDLRCEVTVPPAVLGDEGGAKVPVPLFIGGVQRADPHGDGEHIRLHLPAGMDSGRTLRLRGVGGRCDEGRPGDLYITVHVHNQRFRRTVLWLGLALSVAGVAALLWVV